VAAAVLASLGSFNGHHFITLLLASLPSLPSSSMDPSSTLAAQSQPHLSRDEKRHLFEEQKQQRLERYVACMLKECVYQA